MLPRVSAPSRRAGRFAVASELAWRPRTRTSWGRQSVSALSGSSRPMLGAYPKVGACRSRLVDSPKTAAVSGPARSRPRRERKESVACGSGASRRKRLGRIPSNPEGSKGCRWLDPEGRIHPVSPVAPEGARSLTNRIGSPEGAFCDSAHTPKGCAGGSSSCSPALRGHPRTSGQPARRRLPTPEGVVIRAPLAPTSRRTLRRTLPLDPRRNHSGRASRSATRR